MGFELEAARAKGATEGQIFEFLVKKNKFNVGEARRKNPDLTDDAIINLLVPRTNKAQKPPIPIIEPIPAHKPGLPAKEPQLIPSHEPVDIAAPKDPRADIIAALEVPTAKEATTPTPEAPALQRLQAGFFRTPEFKLKVLAKKFGKENVRENPETKELEFRESNQSEYKPFDAPEFTYKDVIDFVSDAFEILPQEVFEKGGAIAGGLTPIPGAAATGKIVGAGAGQVLGRGAQLAAQKLILDETEPFDITEEFLTGAGTEAVLMGLGGLANRLVRPSAKNVAAKEARDMLIERKVPLTASQATESWMLDMFDRISKDLPGGGKTIDITKQGIEGFERSIEKEAIERFGTPIDKVGVGKHIGASLENVIDSVKEQAKDNYGKFRDLIPTVKSFVPDATGVGLKEVDAIPAIPMSNIAEKASGLISKIQETAKKPQDTAGIISFLERLSGLKDMSIDKIADQRSLILEASRDLHDVLPGKASRYLAILNEAIEKDLDNWGKKYGRGVVDQLKLSNSAYREGMQLVSNAPIMKVLRGIERKSLPLEQVLDVFAGEKRITNPDLLRKAIGEDAFGRVKAGVVYNIIDSAKDLVTEGGEVFLSPAKLGAAIRKYQKGGGLNSILSQREQQAIGNWFAMSTILSPTEKRIIAKAGSGWGSAMRSVLFGSAAGVATQDPIATATITAGIPLISRILQEPNIVSFLVKTGKIKSAGKEAVKGFVRSGKVSVPLRIAARKALLGIIQEVTGQNVIDEKKPPQPALRGL